MPRGTRQSHCTHCSSQVCVEAAAVGGSKLGSHCHLAEGRLDSARMQLGRSVGATVREGVGACPRLLHPGRQSLSVHLPGAPLELTPVSQPELCLHRQASIPPIVQVGKLRL